MSTAQGAIPGVHYFYFGRNLWPRHHGILTAGAFLQIPESKPGTPPEPEILHVAFAYCAPEDTFRRFSAVLPGRKGEGATRIVKGGVDLVNARLGLTEMHDVAKNVYSDVFRGGSVLRAVMDIFNTLVPRNERPRIWHDRQLLVAPRQALYRLDLASNAELADLDKLANPHRQQPGFVRILRFPARR